MTNLLASLTQENKVVIVLVRKPLIKNVADTIVQHNCGGINIDGTRIGEGTGEIISSQRPNMKGGNYGQDSEDYGKRNTLNYFSVDKGRFPANVLLSENTNTSIDRQSGTEEQGASRYFKIVEENEI